MARRKSKKQYYTDPLTGQRKEVGATYNPITGRKIPKGHYEDSITGQLRKNKNKNKVNHEQK